MTEYYNTQFSQGDYTLPHTQTWKKLQAVQAVLADILSEIPLFWGPFDSNIHYFWLRMKEEELKMEIWSWIKEIIGKKMGNRWLKINIKDGKL